MGQTAGNSGSAAAQSPASLEREAQYFHERFFGTAPDPDVIARYVSANLTCLPFPDARASRMIDTIISERLDVEAIEYVLRLRNRENILTKKIKVLFFMVEVRARYFDCFFSLERARLKALTGLLVSVVLTALKYVKGHRLIRRHDLV